MNETSGGYRPLGFFLGLSGVYRTKGGDEEDTCPLYRAKRSKRCCAGCGLSRLDQRRIDDTVPFGPRARPCTGGKSSSSDASRKGKSLSREHLAAHPQSIASPFLIDCFRSWDPVLPETHAERHNQMIQPPGSSLASPPVGRRKRLLRHFRFQPYPHFLSV